MREILFRGKRIDDYVNDKSIDYAEKGIGEWVYGDIIHRRYYKNEDVVVIRTEDSGFDNYSDYEVDPSTVGQCVSDLTDKNGKKIFDGDIVHYQCSDVIAEVKIGEYRDTDSHKDAYGCYVEFVEDDQIVQEVMNHMESNETYGCEVIGNIHDNPELLEDKP
jgi:uncharacterized phage protein (TIGR01671 family)